MDDVPIQYFQSVIAIELAVTGALLFQIRYFAPRNQAEEDLPDPRLRLAVAVLLGATLFGSLEAMLHGGDKTAAAAVMIGLAVSLVPILLRVLPPLRREAQSHERRSDVAVTIAGVVAVRHPGRRGADTDRRMTPKRSESLYGWQQTFTSGIASSCARGKE